VTIGEWVVLVLACGAGIAGLLLAASGSGETVYVLGLALFIGAIAYAGLFIKCRFDRLERGSD
jgi:hypothetical protein